jgi:hypothetical protein
LGIALVSLLSGAPETKKEHGHLLGAGQNGELFITFGQRKWNDLGLGRNWLKPVGALVHGHD